MINLTTFKRKSLINVVILAAMLVCLLGSVQPVAANTITVNVFLDEFGTNTNNCSLREAIRAANTDTAFGGCPAGKGADVINLSAGTYVLSLGTTKEADDQKDVIGAIGDLDITSPLVIIGAGEGEDGTKIRPEAGSKTRVFHIAARGFSVSIQHLTVTNGYAFFTIDAGTPDDETLGGGIFNEVGYLTLYRVTVDGNKAHHSGGGVYSFRNDAYNSLTIRDVTIRNNVAENGDGGGLISKSKMVMTKSLVWNNTANQGNGGGIYNDAPSQLTNVTIAENKVLSPTGRGAGVFSNYPLEILNSTIVKNQTASRTSYGIEIENGSGFLMNNIIAYNKSNVGGQLASANCWFAPGRAVGTYNYRDVDEKDGSNQPICKGTGTNFLVTNSNIGLSDTLDKNYGRTESYTLLSSSGLIDQGHPNKPFIHPTTGKNYQCLGFDQRYALAPIDGNKDGIKVCDPGSVEYFDPADGFPFAKNLYLPAITR